LVLDLPLIPGGTFMRRTRLLAVAAVLVLAGCSSTTTHPVAASTTATPSTQNVKSAIANWFNGGGGTRITAIGTDAKSAAGSAEGPDIATLRTACTALQSDVESAQAYAPIPDAQMQSAWSSALAQYARAAGDCIAGVDSMDATVISRASSELGAASGFMDQATARAQALGGG
jgi:hypothetical protein